jgi:hypothetical protein
MIGPVTVLLLLPPACQEVLLLLLLLLLFFVTAVVLSVMLLLLLPMKGGGCMETLIPSALVAFVAGTGLESSTAVLLLFRCGIRIPLCTAKATDCCMLPLLAGAAALELNGGCSSVAAVLTLG